MKKSILILALLVCGSAWGGSGLDWLSELRDCRDVTSALERVACYDAFVAKFDDGETESQPGPSVGTGTGSASEAGVPVEAPQQRHGHAGTSNPEWAQAPEDSSDGNAEEPRRFTGMVVQITQTSAGRHRFITEDGAVWEQTQDVRVRLPGSLPVEVQFRRRITGNPTISFEGSRSAYRVRRVQ